MIYSIYPSAHLLFPLYTNVSRNSAKGDAPVTPAMKGHSFKDLICQEMMRSNISDGIESRLGVTADHERLIFMVNQTTLAATKGELYRGELCDEDQSFNRKSARAINVFGVHCTADSGI